ncbi:MAG: hypothetical protein H6818_05410 [Phycisphaerales bacterium]|nr:hypothetical protein [Phycisphaerales bacterium]
MGAKLCPHIILEGTRLTHKTDVAFALNEHPRFVGVRKYRYHSPIVSAEWCGFTNRPWGRGLINFAPDEADKAVETYQTWMRLFELQRYYSWIVDRFHISTQVYQQRVHQNSMNFEWLEERLATLNFRLVLLTREDASFEQARAERLKVSMNPSQYNDLSIFIEEQSALRTAVKASRLKTLEVDISHGHIDLACRQIVDWFEATGGLHQT